MFGSHWFISQNLNLLHCNYKCTSSGLPLLQEGTPNLQSLNIESTKNDYLFSLHVYLPRLTTLNVRPVNSHHLMSVSRSHHQSTNSYYRIASDNKKLEVGGLKFDREALSNIRVRVRQNLIWQYWFRLSQKLNSPPNYPATCTCSIYTVWLTNKPSLTPNLPVDPGFHSLSSHVCYVSVSILMYNL